MGWADWRGLVMLEELFTQVGPFLVQGWSVFSSRLPIPESKSVSLQGFVKTLAKCSKLGDDGVDRADFGRLRGWSGIRNQ
jgi:hypothetical protein